MNENKFENLNSEEEPVDDNKDEIIQDTGLSKVKKIGKQHNLGQKGRVLGEGAQNIVREAPIIIRRSNQEKTLNMAVRNRKDASMNEYIQEERERQFQIRNHLLEKGVPVIPTYRLDEKTGDIYMTNLTVNHGRQQYVIGNFSADTSVINQRIKKGDFAEGISNKEELLEDLWSIVERCANDGKTENGLALMNSDALFFLIDPESLKAKVLVGDYKHLSGISVGGRKFSQEEMIKMNVDWAVHALKKWNAALGISSEDAKEFFNAKLKVLKASE